MTDYELLKSFGHCPAKAAEIAIDARRGNNHAITWVAIARLSAQHQSEAEAPAMLHLTSCRRIGKDSDPLSSEITVLRDDLIGIQVQTRRSNDLIGFSRSELEICIAALRIVSEL